LKARSGLLISVIELLLLGVTAEALRAKSLRVGVLH